MLPLDLIWSSSLFDEAIPLLARQAAYLSADEKTTILPFPENDTTQETVSQWLDMAAIQMGLEFQTIETNYSDLETMLTQGGSAILQISGSV